MKLYAVFFVTSLKLLILSTIRSYYRNYTDTGSALSSGLKAILKAEHSMLKLKMLNQTRFLFNVVYHKVLPLAHLCYINDMPNCLEKANIRTLNFADDTTLFYSSNSLQDLEKTINEEFNHLLSYCSANKLSVNFKKTHYMTISSPQKQINLSLIYAILKKRTTSNT